MQSLYCFLTLKKHYFKQFVDGVLTTLCSKQIVIISMAFHTGAEGVFSLQRFKSRFSAISLFRAVMVLVLRIFLKTLPFQGASKQFFP